MAPENHQSGTGNERAKTDVFISYSSHDREKAAMVAEALTRAGLNVWWDRALLPGDSYEGSIEVALKEAKAVVVCWTQAAVTSDWVRSEADDARVNGKLCPVFMEDCQLPKPFDRVHTENLVGWRGNTDHHAYQELEEAVMARVEGRVAKAIPWRRKWLTRGAFISLVAMIGVAAANVSLLKDIFFPAETVTSSEVERIVAAALAQAAAQGGLQLGERDQENLRNALASVLESTEAEKADARAQLAVGNLEEAANALADAAKRQAEAAGGVLTKASETWVEAGAIYAASDTQKAIEAYEEAVRLDPLNPEAANGLGPLYERVGKVQEADALYRSILDGRGKEEPVWRAKALGNLALLAESRGDWADAEAGIIEAMGIFEAEGDQVSVAKALVNLGRIGQSSEELDKSERYSKRGMALSKEIGLTKGEAIALANLGYVEMARNNNEGARDYFTQAEALMEQEGMETELGLIYINRTRMLSLEGRVDDAELMARKALAVAQRMHSRLSEAGAYNHLGILARDRGDFAEAEKYQTMAIEIFEKLERRKELEQEYRSYAITAEKKNDFPEAILRYEKSLEISNTLDDPLRQGNTLVVLARLYLEQGDIETARVKLDEAAERFVEVEDEYGMGEVTYLYGRSLLMEGNTQGAVDSYANATEHFMAAEEPEMASKIMIDIADLAFREQDPIVAETALTEALSLMPDSAPKDMRAYALFPWLRRA